jgi:glycosyltransferase involved in cell wall biosynthesis
MIWFYWTSGLLLALLWTFVAVQIAIHQSELVHITAPEWALPADAALPSLTIVVAARNEEAEAEPALQSLLDLNYPAYEVIAVDDRSTDRTGEIMKRLAAKAPDRLRVLHVQELPPRWLGKTHAMWLGAQAGAGEWLLFTDADCVFQPESVTRAIHYATKNRLDHLVLFPTMHMDTLGERMMLTFPTVILNFALHRPWKIKDPNAPDHIGVGAFNLIRRAAYTGVGTYEKLRLEVADDLRLGQAVKKAGFRQDVVFGRGLVRLRWAAGARGVIRNLEKNIYAALRFRASLVIAFSVTLLFLCVWPFVGLALAPGWARCGFAAAVASIAVVHAQVSRQTGVSPLVFPAFPLAALLFIYAAARSAFIARRDGAVTWRGTRYAIAELRRKD